ncbi:hypothetical protein M885DRAFT_551381 [Pelagophyceae sp. CCMP2097]|nr:hypothetical protein M885DRAFT_551381 [Pelagophyceae sp. CCMP2097]
MGLALNYRDAILSPEQLELFQGANWLIDQSIHLGFKLLEDDFQVGGRVLLMDPNTCGYLSLYCDDEDLDELARGVDLAERDVVITAICDAGAGDEPRGGSHWSLIAIYGGERYVHFDSLAPRNERVAARVALKFARLFRCVDAALPPRPAVEQAEMPRQLNGSDCGVYVLAAARLLLRHGLS